MKRNRRNTRNYVESSESEDDRPLKKTPPSSEKKPTQDNDSSSESDIENYFTKPEKLDFNSDFFKSKNDPEFENIEKSIFSGITRRLSDSESESNDGKEETQDIVNNGNAKVMPESNLPSEMAFQQLQDYTKKIEEAKKFVERYKAKKEAEEKKNDIHELLALGEKNNQMFSNINPADLHSSDFESCESEEEAEWKEVKSKPDQETEKQLISQKNIQITVSMPETIKKKKGVDLIAAMKRRLNRIRKENQVLVHKVHLLCWLAHGSYINSALNETETLAMALSLIPSEQCYPSDRPDLAYLEQITNWYRKTIALTEKSIPNNITFDTFIRLQIKKKEAYNKKMLACIFVSIIRALGIQCRIVMSLEVEPLRPPTSELHSLSQKVNEKPTKKKSSLNKSKTEPVASTSQSLEKKPIIKGQSRKNTNKEQLETQNQSSELKKPIKSSTKGENIGEKGIKTSNNSKKRPHSIENQKAKKKDLEQSENNDAVSKENQLTVPKTTRRPRSPKNTEKDSKESTSANKKDLNQSENNDTASKENQLTIPKTIRRPRSPKSTEKGTKEPTSAKKKELKQSEIKDDAASKENQLIVPKTRRLRSPKNTEDTKELISTKTKDIKQSGNNDAASKENQLTVPKTTRRPRSPKNTEKDSKESTSAKKKDLKQSENNDAASEENQLTVPKTRGSRNPKSTEKDSKDSTSAKKKDLKQSENNDAALEEKQLSVNETSRGSKSPKSTDQESTSKKGDFNDAGSAKNIKSEDTKGTNKQASKVKENEPAKTKLTIPKIRLRPKSAETKKLTVKSNTHRSKSTENEKGSGDKIKRNLPQVDGTWSTDSDEEMEILQVDGGNENRKKNSKPNLKVLKISKCSKTKQLQPKKVVESDSGSDFELPGVSKSQSQKPNLKKLYCKKSKQMDIKDDIINLIKGRIAEQKYIDRKRMVKKRKPEQESESDSDYIPEPIKKKHHDSEDDFVPKVRVKRRVQIPGKIPEEEKPAKKKIGNDVWVEVFLEAEEKWICVDVVHGQVHCIKEIYQRATHPVSYIIGWDNNNNIKDITQRYCTNFNTVTRKERVDRKWWAESLKPFMAIPTARDKEEDDDLVRQQMDQPLPKSISEYKNHPLYALKRHLLKFEALYPPVTPTLGFIRGEAVYPRSCVYVLHSRDIWLKQAKVVKLGEKPYKIVKARPKYDKLSNKVITDQLLEIYGPWQVQDYEPPTAENGVVPKNAFGNVDLFKPCMLPKGTVHLKLPGLNKIARKMNVDCASAIIGFDFHGGWSHPIYDGFVVCKEYEDQLILAWEIEQDELDRREQEKIDKRVYGNWRRLIKGLLIKERLKAKYDFGEPSTSNSTDKKKSKAPSFCTKRRS